MIFQQILTPQLYHRACCFVLFFVAAAASFGGFYGKYHLSEGFYSGDGDVYGIESILDGTAHRPFVYRQMLPDAANWIAKVVPRSIESWIYLQCGQNNYLNAIAASPTAMNRAYFLRYLVVYLATFLFALLAVYFMYFVCRAVEIPQPAAVAAPVIVILLIPYIMQGGGYFYDYPELAFFALAVWIAIKFDWWWVIPVAALGTWNKESFLLFIPTLYPILRWRRSRPGALLGIGVLCLVCAVVYYPIRSQFAHNPGAALEVHLGEHLHSLLHPQWLLTSTAETYGVPAMRVFSVFPLALLIWTVWRVWRRVPNVIQRHGQIAAAINIPLYLVFCSPGELRDLSMLYIVLLVVLAVSLNDWIGGLEQAHTPQTGSSA